MQAATGANTKVSVGFTGCAHLLIHSGRQIPHVQVGGEGVPVIKRAQVIALVRDSVVAPHALALLPRLLLPKRAPQHTSHVSRPALALIDPCSSMTGGKEQLLSAL